ncbi:transposase [Thalassococcus sp. S3]|uniref:transposase n=1 Tax=Thalassococcus sp. S3 TaxID=2017482 RepID=UPI001024431F|nr:transposase [Thalassococcus sp. S3]QBF30787.1 hypothetical protein CFI11_06095 [Thalassococcus sp. S3]
MPRTRTPYPAAFREQIVELHKTGRSAEDLAREFEPCVATIHAWIRQAERDGGKRADDVSCEMPTQTQPHPKDQVLRQRQIAEDECRTPGSSATA